MKKYIFTLVFVALFMGTYAHATVGGPTLISDLKFNSQDASVYYVEQSYSGRGCPPTLEKMSVVDPLQRSTVFSCDDLQSLSTDEAYNEIYGVIASYKDLTPINLSKNGITIDVDFVREEKIDEDWVIKSNFIASVSQNGNVIAQYPISGCNKEQPFTFAGYAIPSLTKKFILLLSTKGDCFEGGYINESLYVVLKGDVIDRTSPSNSLKNQNPLVPTEATLIVFTKNDNKITPTPTPTPTPDINYDTPATKPPNTTDKNSLITALIAAAFLIFGVALGYHVEKK